MIPTALHVQFSQRGSSYVHISTFVFFFMLCSAVFSFLHRNDMVCQHITNSKIMNVNLVQSLAINLPHTLRCNLQFTIIIIRT